MGVWRSDREVEKDEDDRRYLLAEAWSIGLAIAAGFVLVLVSLLGVGKGL